MSEAVEDAGDDIEPMLSFGDAYEIGERVVEMADRVKAASRIVPGAQARWGLTLDGIRFEMLLTMQAPKGGSHG